MPPSGLPARLAILMIALGLLASACAAGAADPPRIGSVNQGEPEDDAETASDPRDGLGTGQVGGSDPTAGGSSGAGTDPGVPGGRSGGADPSGGTSADIDALLAQVPGLGPFAGVYTSAYTITYSMSPALIQNLRITNYPTRNQAVLTEYGGGSKTWTFYEGLTMTVSCETARQGWQCRKTDEPLTITLPKGLDPKNLAKLRLHSILFTGLAASADFEPVAQTQILGYPTTCYLIGSGGGSTCLDATGVSLKVDIDFGDSIVFVATSYTQTADPADAVPPAPVQG